MFASLVSPVSLLRFSSLAIFESVVVFASTTAFATIEFLKSVVSFSFTSMKFFNSELRFSRTILFASKDFTIYILSRGTSYASLQPKALRSNIAIEFGRFFGEVERSCGERVWVDDAYLDSEFDFDSVTWLPPDVPTVVPAIFDSTFECSSSTSSVVFSSCLRLEVAIDLSITSEKFMQPFSCPPSSFGSASILIPSSRHKSLAFFKSDTT
mmetsp:Transcript_11879/g.17699  ORF Transcript_11879/g.17699 Transcript_11879/m.17699 type:complete len:211 (+) Transcript_11879:433-1065(+)